MEDKHISELNIKASLDPDDIIPIYDSTAGGNKGIKLVDLIATLNNKTLDEPVITTPDITGGTIDSPAITTPTGIVKADVGLSNVDNTSDATKNSASATLTNKTLTTPKIDTITEETSANGVTIDSLNIKDGKLNTNNSVVTTNITDENITLGKLSTAVQTSISNLQAPPYASGYIGSNTGVGYKTLYQAINSGITFDGTNKYTIVTAGIYYIHFQQLINTTASATYLMIHKNGASNKFAWQTGSHMEDMTVTNLLSLAVGDYIQCYQSVAVANAWEGEHSSYQIMCIKRT